MCAEQLGIGRAEQDEHAIASVERARAATAAGLVDWEVTGIEVPAKGGGTQLFAEVRRSGGGGRGWWGWGASGQGPRGWVPLSGGPRLRRALPHLYTLPHASRICSVLSLGQDEAIHKMNADKLRKLKPFFRPQSGTVTGAGRPPCLPAAAHAAMPAGGARVHRTGRAPARTGGGKGGGGQERLPF